MTTKIKSINQMYKPIAGRDLIFFDKKIAKMVTYSDR
jgi:hypothetical protein